MTGEGKNGEQFYGLWWDDVTRNEGAWSQICNSCLEQHGDKIPVKVLSECAGTPICGLTSCENIASYYVDFEE